MIESNRYERAKAKLIPSRRVVLEILLQSLEGTKFQMKELAAASGLSEATARKALKGLERTGWIRCVYHNLGSAETCFELVWIKYQARMTPPCGRLLESHKKSYILSHPDQGQELIIHGEIRRFAREKSLDYRALRAVLAGERKTHKKWRLSA